MTNNQSVQDAYTYLARFYDQLMEVDYPNWVTYLEHIWQQLGVTKPRILDLGCGTGNITFELYRRGYQVTGVDLSEAMIAQAKKKSSELDAAVDFIQQDMRQLKLDQQFDVVVSCCDVLNYVTAKQDLQDCLLSAHRHTKTQGLLLFDLNSELKLREIYGNESYAELKDDYGYFWDNYFEEETAICRMDLSFFIPGAGGLYQRVHERHYQKLWRPEYVFNLLANTGWELLGYYGFLTWEEPQSDVERWQFVARKQ